ncbi:MAG: MoxR family ATPase [Candidatus Tectomicrobia bacterium]|nr:MoxR family ATPase [Candidatus Tectomicrobia bacterium]
MDDTERLRALQASIEQVLIGKTAAIRLALVTLFAQGHLLIEDVPGVGKTTLARALARCLACSFQRIQFTPDLLPSDILGVSIYHAESGRFEFKPGPIFANVVLADEINRASPRTQSSLLEAMNEGQVSVDGVTHELPRPFMVIGTQNPLEFEGTYTLPEAQLDRFLIRLAMGYPERQDERRVLLDAASRPPVDALAPVLSVSEVEAIQDQVRRVRIEPSLVDYLLDIVRATRESPHLEVGVSPRGALALQRAAQALAFVNGRAYVIPDDIKQLTLPVLAHRVLLRDYLSQAPLRAATEVLQDILDKLPVPL